MWPPAVVRSDVGFVLDLFAAFVGLASPGVLN
jgi:hypothetical protein